MRNNKRVPASIDTRNLDYGNFSSNQANPIGYQEIYLLQTRYNKVGRNTMQKENYNQNQNFKQFSNNSTPKQDINIRLSLDPKDNLSSSYKSKFDPISANRTNSALHRPKSPMLVKKIQEKSLKEIPETFNANANQEPSLDYIIYMSEYV